MRSASPELPPEMGQLWADNMSAADVGNACDGLESRAVHCALSSQFLTTL